jgi:uncharacterized protein (DUF4415 family)
MEREYDLSKARKNPYAENLRRAATVVIDSEILDFFKEIAKEKGVYHGELISETLKDYIIKARQEGQI